MNPETTLEAHLFSLVIIDDEESIRRGLSQYVDWKSMGFKVKGTFEDGKEALEYLKSHTVDAILTDIKMAQISGLEVAEYTSDNCPGTKVIIMSGHQDFEYARQALKYNARDYLLKPVDIETLKKVFSKLKSELEEQNRITRIKEVLGGAEKPLMDALLAVKPSNSEELAAVIKSISSSDEDYERDYSELIIKKAKEYIKDNFCRDITLEEIAEKVHLSPVYFSRFFKDKTGINFIDYLTEIRIKEAIKLLDSHQYKVQEISKMIGYQSSKYFARVFKQTTGYSPTEYVHRIL